MKNLAGRTKYEERLGRVTAYLYDHLDDELDLGKLAEVACLSPYHWHRIYHGVHGESVIEAVKRLRLQRAAAQLAQTAMPIAEIAKRSGYPSLPSFTRIFKSAFGMPPARYRDHGSHTMFKPHPNEGSPAMFEVEIETVPILHAASIEHSGAYLQIGRAFDRLFGALGAQNLIAPSMRLVGIYLDDPTCVPEAKLRSLAGALIDAGAPVDSPWNGPRFAAGPMPSCGIGAPMRT